MKMEKPSPSLRVLPMETDILAGHLPSQYLVSTRLLPRSGRRGFPKAPTVDGFCPFFFCFFRLAKGSPPFFFFLGCSLVMVDVSYPVASQNCTKRDGYADYGFVGSNKSTILTFRGSCLLSFVFLNLPRLHNKTL